MDAPPSPSPSPPPPLPVVHRAQTSQRSPSARPGPNEAGPSSSVSGPRSVVFRSGNSTSHEKYQLDVKPSIRPSKTPIVVEVSSDSRSTISSDSASESEHEMENDWGDDSPSDTPSEAPLAGDWLDLKNPAPRLPKVAISAPVTSGKQVKRESTVTNNDAVQSSTKRARVIDDQRTKPIAKRLRSAPEAVTPKIEISDDMDAHIGSSTRHEKSEFVASQRVDEIAGTSDTLRPLCPSNAKSNLTFKQRLANFKQLKQLGMADVRDKFKRAGVHFDLKFADTILAYPQRFGDLRSRHAAATDQRSKDMMVDVCRLYMMVSALALLDKQE